MFDYQVFYILIKIKILIMSVFHSVPGVPCAKMERFRLMISTFRI